MKKLSSQDRKSLIRLASSLPQGSGERRAILAGLTMEEYERQNPRPKLNGGQEKRYVGSVVHRRDKAGVVLLPDYRTPGDLGPVGVRLFNPNRGTAFFRISEVGDFDKLAKSMQEALAQAKRDFVAWDKEEDVWWTKMKDYAATQKD